MQLRGLNFVYEVNERHQYDCLSLRQNRLEMETLSKFEGSLMSSK